MRAPDSMVRKKMVTTMAMSVTSQDVSQTVPVMPGKEFGLEFSVKRIWMVSKLLGLPPYSYVRVTEPVSLQ